MREQRLARGGSSNQRGRGCDQQNAPATIGEPDEEGEAKQDPDEAHGSDLLQQRVEVEGGALAEVPTVGAQEALRGVPAFLP